MSSKLSEAFPVNCMATWHFMRSTPGTKKKFLTNGTVGLVLSALAIMIRIQALINAHSAIMAVLEIFRTANAAKSAVWTVIWFFIVCHPKVAYTTVVFSKLYPAVYTIVPRKKEKRKKTGDISLIKFFVSRSILAHFHTYVLELCLV
jgi:hypothetical protein